jgi:hypothetical protein
MEIKAIKKQATNIDANGIQYYRYTFNLHVTDKDGANLSGATVNLYGSDATDYDTAAWTEDSILTQADGTIAEQTVTVKKWVGTSEVLTDYNSFKLEISAPGYQTLTMENLEISEPVSWHVELQDTVAAMPNILIDTDGELYKTMGGRIILSLGVLD